MKKTILIIFSVLFLTACNSSLKLTSKVKQTVYPGRHTEKAYINYVLKFSINTNETISIDSVGVYYEKKCYTTNKYLLKKDKSASYIKKIIQQGDYILEIPLKKEHTFITQNCKNQKSEVIIYYQEGKVSKNLFLDNFIEERKTKR